MEQEIKEIIEAEDQYEVVIMTEQLRKQINLQNQQVIKRNLDKIYDAILIKIDLNQLVKIEMIKLMNQLQVLKLRDHSDKQIEILNNVLISLGNDEANIRKASHQCLHNYVKQFNDFQSILDIFYDNIDINNDLIKQKSINSFQSIFIQENHRIDWHKCQHSIFNYIDKLLEIILTYQNQVVVKAAEQTVVSIIKENKFQIVFDSLSQKNQNIINDYRSKLQIPLFMINNNNAISISNSNKNEIKQHLKTIEESMVFNENNPPNNAFEIFDYGVIPSKIVEDLRNSQDWQTKIANIQLLEKVVLQNNKANSKEYIQYAPDILKFLLNIVETDNNIQISSKCLNMIQQIVQNHKLNIASVQNQTVEILVNKMSDNKVTIKQQSMNIVKNIIKQSRIINYQLYFSIFQQRVNSTNQNEVLNLVYFILHNYIQQIRQDYQFSKVFIQFLSNYQNIQIVGEMVSILRKQQNNSIDQQLAQFIDNQNYQILTTGINRQDSQQNPNRLIKNKSNYIQNNENNLQTQNTANKQRILTSYSQQQNTVNSNFFEDSTAPSKIFDSTLKSYNFKRNRKEKQQESRAVSVQMDINNQQSRLSSAFNDCQSQCTQNKSNNIAEQVEDDRFYKPKLRQKKNEQKNIEEEQRDQKSVYNETMKSSNMKMSFRKTVASNSLGNNFDYSKPQYIEWDDLEPLDNMSPQQIMAQLQEEDWIKKFQGFNALRRTVKYNSQLINQKNIQQFIKEILKGMDNLRSGITKISLMTLIEFAQQYQKMLDVECESILVKIIKKSQDTSAFIAEEVNKALYTVSQTLTDTKVLTQVQNHVNNKSNNVRLSLNTSIQGLIDKSGQKLANQNQILDKIVTIVGSLLIDNNNQVRQQAKQNYNLLVQNVDQSQVNQILQKTHHQNYQKIMKLVENMRGTMHSSNFNSTIQKSEQSPLKMRPTNNVPQGNSNNAMQGATNMSELNTVLEKGNSNEWQKRMQCINELSEICSDQHYKLKKSKQLQPFIDTFLKLMVDNNNKVQLVALQEFNQIFTLLDKTIEQNLNNVMASLVQVLCSRHKEVLEIGNELMNGFVLHLDASLLTTQICNQITYGPVKARSHLVVTLAQLYDELPNNTNLKQPSIQKHLIPSISKLLDENKNQEIKYGLQQLVQKMHSRLGDGFVEQFSHKNQVSLNNLLQ